MAIGISYVWVEILAETSSTTNDRKAALAKISLVWVGRFLECQTLDFWMGHVIGFKTSRHSGQQFLTFRPAKVVYEYRRPALYPKSGQSIKYIDEYADYGDFLTFSETALTTYAEYEMLTSTHVAAAFALRLLGRG